VNWREPHAFLNRNEDNSKRGQSIISVKSLAIRHRVVIAPVPRFCQPVVSREMMSLAAMNAE
jgi:hypothetical protein